MNISDTFYIHRTAINRLNKVKKIRIKEYLNSDLNLYKNRGFYLAFTRDFLIRSKICDMNIFFWMENENKLK